MARVVIKRLNKLSGSAVKHNVYLDNQYIGILKNGGVLPFEAAAGVHTIHFETASGPLVKKEDVDFRLSVNTDDELIEIKASFNLRGEYVVEYADGKYHTANYDANAESGGIKCPACGSTDLTTITESHTTGRDFNSSDACCGYLLCGPLGLLMGVDKKGKQQHTDAFWICKNCGNKFKM